MSGKIWIYMTAFFAAGMVSLLISTGIYETKLQNELNATQSQLTITQEKLENAEMSAEKYREQYRQSIIENGELTDEITQLKEQNEELEEQIENLRRPPDGVYDDDFGWDYDYVVRVVGAEARGEPFAGMLAVAQCIADTAERTGMTPEQVVKSGQYTNPVPRSCTDNMETVNEACLIVFAEHHKPFNEPIEYFYSTVGCGYSSWHESQIFCYEIGSHRYFKAR